MCVVVVCLCLRNFSVQLSSKKTSLASVCFDQSYLFCQVQREHAADKTSASSPPKMQCFQCCFLMPPDLNAGTRKAVGENGQFQKGLDTRPLVATRCPKDAIRTVPRDRCQL